MIRDTVLKVQQSDREKENARKDENTTKPQNHMQQGTTFQRILSKDEQTRKEQLLREWKERGERSQSGVRGTDTSSQSKNKPLDTIKTPAPSTLIPSIPEDNYMYRTQEEDDDVVMDRIDTAGWFAPTIPGSSHPSSNNQPHYRREHQLKESVGRRESFVGPGNKGAVSGMFKNGSVAEAEARRKEKNFHK